MAREIDGCGGEVEVAGGSGSVGGGGGVVAVAGRRRGRPRKERSADAAVARREALCEALCGDEADEARGMPYLMEAAATEVATGGSEVGGEFGDLVRIPVALRRKGLVFLGAYAKFGRSRPAMDAAHMAAWEVARCRRISKVYMTAHESLREARYAENAAEIEEVMVGLATGKQDAVDGKIPPDVRAASLLLPVMNARYRDAGVAAQQVQINISV